MTTSKEEKEQEEIANIFRDFRENLEANQKDIDPDIRKIVDDNFEDLIL